MRRLIVIGGVSALVSLPLALFIQNIYGALAGTLYALVFSSALTWLAIDVVRRTPR